MVKCPLEFHFYLRLYQSCCEIMLSVKFTTCLIIEYFFTSQFGNKVVCFVDNGLAQLFNYLECNTKILFDHSIFLKIEMFVVVV